MAKSCQSKHRSTSFFSIPLTYALLSLLFGPIAFCGENDGNEFLTPGKQPFFWSWTETEAKRTRTKAAQAESCKCGLFWEEDDENDPPPPVLDTTTSKKRDTTTEIVCLQHSRHTISRCSTHPSAGKSDRV